MKIESAIDELEKLIERVDILRRKLPDSATFTHTALDNSYRQLRAALSSLCSFEKWEYHR